MTDTLYRLVYLSRNDIADAGADLDNQIHGILETSRRNNRRAGVTGALMFNTGCFAQVLEGPHNTVQATFERIQCDERHSNVTVLAFDQADRRTFSNWAMAYVGREAGPVDQFASLNDDAGVDFAAMDGDDIYKVLKQNLEEAESA